MELINILNEEYHRRKKVNHYYSLRGFAKYLEVSPAQLSQILSLKRPITLKFVKKVQSKLMLTPLQQKKVYLQIDKKDQNIQGSIERGKIESNFSQIADWYYLAILAMTKIKNINSDVSNLSKKLNLSRPTVNEAIKKLQNLGILSTGKRFKQMIPPFEAISEFPSESIRKYHKQNLTLAIYKIDTIENHLREFQSISLAINPKKISEFKELINTFMDDASDLANSGTATEVYNLNVQFFPVTNFKE